MIVCPHCGSENLEGADLCDDCQHSLTDLSVPELATAVERGLLKDRIEMLEPRSALTTTVGTSVGEVLNQMVDAGIGCVIVVDGDQIKGIFSERDALMRLNAEVASLKDKPIESLMTPDPVTLDAQDKIAFALHKMHVGGYRHLPILSDGQLQGVISIRDILQYITERIGTAA